MILIHKFLEKTRDTFSQFSNEKEDITSTKIIEISIEILKNTFPLLIKMSPLFFSKVINFRILTPFELVLAACAVIHHPPEKLDLHSILTVNHVMLSILNTLDSASIMPPPFHIIKGGVTLAGTAIGGAYAIWEGSRLIKASRKKQEETSNRVSNFASGVILATFGTFGLYNSYRHAQNFCNGLELLKTIDPQQKEHVFRNRAIDCIAKEKSCRAVAIDGTYHIPEMLSSPLTEALYKKCDTRVYVINSDSQFCEVLRDAKKAFNAPIDKISLAGHANTYQIQLGNDYIFQGGQTEMNCMEEALAPDAQVFLVGCLTAASDDNLTKKLSQSLPGKEIIGFSSFYHLLFTTTSISNKRISHECYCPFRSAVSNIKLE